MSFFNQKKIPERRLEKLFPPSASHAEMKINLRNIGAWNAGLAMASSKQTLELILISQQTYPLHLIPECQNNFILFFHKPSMPMMHPGRIPGNERPNYIGPSYGNLSEYAVIKSGTPSSTSIVNLYELLNDIRNKTPNKFYSEEHLKLADALIERQAVVI